MRKLIVSLDTYAWAGFCVDLILEDPSSFDILIVYKNDDRPIFNSYRQELCQNAIYVQRCYDLFKIGKLLGVKKLINLGYCRDEINISKITTQLNLYILIGGVDTIYCEYSPILSTILTKLVSKTNCQVIYFHTMTVDWNKNLDMRKKIQDLMVGEVK